MPIHFIQFVFNPKTWTGSLVLFGHLNIHFYVLSDYWFDVAIALGPTKTLRGVRLIVALLFITVSVAVYRDEYIIYFGGGEG